MRMRGLLAIGAALMAGAAAWAANKPGKDEEPPEVRYAFMLEREYGPLGTSTEQILAREATHEPVTIVGALVYRLRGKPPERLTLVEKKLLAVYGLKEEVDNGGFTQYFNGPVADGLTLALQGLQDMQAARLLRPVQKALTVFPGAKLPADPLKRAKLVTGVRGRALNLWSTCEGEFYLAEEDLASLAFAYAKKHRAQIALP